MYSRIRYQTGELKEIIKEMEEGSIPCMDVYDLEEFEWFAGRMADAGVFKVEGMSYDKNARNRVSEPEFEFRAAFSTKPLKAHEADTSKLMYLDVYFEPEPEETYDSVDEI